MFELGGEFAEIVPLMGLVRFALDIDPVGPLVGQAAVPWTRLIRL